MAVISKSQEQQSGPVEVVDLSLDESAIEDVARALAGKSFPSEPKDGRPKTVKQAMNKSVSSEIKEIAKGLEAAGMETERLELEYEVIEVALPSEGKFYASDSACFGLKQVKVRSLIATDNDIFWSKKIVSKGKLFDALINATMLTEGVTAETLLGPDKLAIIMALRINGIGEEYNPKTKVGPCEFCGAVFDWTFDLSQLEVKEPDPLVEQAEVHADGTFDYKTERGHVLGLKYLTSEEDQEADKEIEASRKIYKNREIDKAFAIRLRHQIVSVDGKREKGFIRSFIESGKLTMKDTHGIRKFLAANIPGLDLRQTVTCPECREEFVSDIEITREFLYPNY